MIRTPHRSVARLAALAVSAAAMFGACSPTASPSASATAAPASQTAGGASPSAAAHKPATITVGVLR
ncbi:MAG TPA: hypothetical protein VHS36_07985, partial [Candidatus Limnocylindrales bacterium]|nr:hypothetical protein [Candidatus Limnocylindrales bacterium]